MSGQCLVRPSGDLDALTVGPLRQQWAHLMAVGNPDCMVVDLRDVTFMDSSGLSALVGLRRQMLLRGGRVEIRGASAQVQRILTITGLTATFPDASLSPESRPVDQLSTDCRAR